MRLMSVNIFHVGDEVRSTRPGDRWRGRISDIRLRGSDHYEFTIEGEGWEVTARLGEFEHTSLLERLAREAEAADEVVQPRQRRRRKGSGVS